MKRYADVVLRLSLHEERAGSHPKPACGSLPPAKIQYLSLCFRNKFQQRNHSRNSNERNTRVCFAKKQADYSGLCFLENKKQRSVMVPHTENNIWPTPSRYYLLFIENVPLFSGLIKSYCHPESQLQLRVFQSQESIVF